MKQFWLFAAILTLAAFTTPNQGKKVGIEHFNNANKSATPNLMLKITWTFVQTEIISSVAFGVDNVPTDSDIALFTPFRTPGVAYGNDDAHSDWRFKVTQDEMTAVINALASLSFVQTVVPPGEVSSLALMDTAAPAVFELLLNGENTKQAIDAIKAALGPGHQGLWSLDEFLKNIP